MMMQQGHGILRIHHSINVNVKIDEPQWFIYTKQHVRETKEGCCEIDFQKIIISV